MTLKNGQRPLTGITPVVFSVVLIRAAALKSGGLALKLSVTMLQHLYSVRLGIILESLMVQRPGQDKTLT